MPNQPPRLVSVPPGIASHGEAEAALGEMTPQENKARARRVGQLYIQLTKRGISEDIDLRARGTI